MNTSGQSPGAAPSARRLTPDQQSLVSDNLRLAHHVALTVLAGRRRPNADDIHAAAVHGLCIAAQRFRPELGFAFSTYAWRWCRRYAQQELRQAQAVTLPIAAVTGDRASALTRALASRSCVPLPDDGDLAAREPEQPEQPEQPEYAASLLAVLPARHAAVVRMRVLEGMTLAAIGLELGITRERVRQIQGRALARLRWHALAAHLGEGGLADAAAA